MEKACTALLFGIYGGTTSRRQWVGAGNFAAKMVLGGRDNPFAWATLAVRRRPMIEKPAIFPEFPQKPRVVVFVILQEPPPQTGINIGLGTGIDDLEDVRALVKQADECSTR